jgi:hypothetical protein
MKSRKLTWNKLPVTPEVNPQVSSGQILTQAKNQPNPTKSPNLNLKMDISQIPIIKEGMETTQI